MMRDNHNSIKLSKMVTKYKLELIPYNGIHLRSTWDQWRRFRRCHHACHSPHTGCSGHVASRGYTLKDDVEFYESRNPT